MARNQLLSAIPRDPEVDDAELVCVDQGGNSPLALMGDVYFLKDADRQFSDPAQRAFVLGHELAHIENGDSKTQLGIKFLLESLDEGPNSKSLELGLLRRELDVQICKMDHRQEYRADKRGLEIAVLLGHDPASAIAFLSGYPESPSHPSGDERIQALGSRS